MPVDPRKEGEEVGRLLVGRRLVLASDLEAARTETATRGGRLATTLYEQGAVDLETLATVLGEIHGVEPAGPEFFERYDPSLIGLVSSRGATKALAVPVARDPRGVDVAFASPSDEGARAALAKELGKPMRVLAAPEPLVYVALRRDYGLARVPKHLETMVDELLASPAAMRRRRPRPAPIPGPADEFVTTPLGGVLPGLPDEVSTSALREPSVVSPDDILYGAGEPSDPLGVAQLALADAKSVDEAVTALLAYCRTVVPASAVLEREGDWFRVTGATGALSGSAARADATVPSLLRAALSGDEGYLGPVPPNPGNAALFAALGREPVEVLLLPLGRGVERVLYADAGARRIEPALVERLRVLARRALGALS
jgi:hypothetical protein